QKVGTATAGPDGSVHASVTIPSDAAPGRYPLIAYGARLGARIQIAVHVVAVGMTPVGALNVNQPYAQVGGSLSFNGSGLQGSEPFGVLIDGSTARIDGSGLTNGEGTASGGNVSFGLNIHNDLAPGQHTIDVLGLVSGRVLHGTFAVTQIAF